MILANHGIVSSSGASFDVDALAFITAASITDNTQKTAINTLVTDLKTYNIWTKMKAIYPFVGGTASSHKWNLKDPRDLDIAYRLVFSGGWTHSSTGALPNGSNTYADTKFKINSPSIAIGTYIRTDTAAANMSEMGVFDNPYNNTNIGAKWSDGNTYSFINISSGTGQTPYVNNNSQGFYIANRYSSTLLNTWKNGVKKTTNTELYQSIGLSINLLIAAYNGSNVISNFSDRQTALSFISDGLTDTEVSNFYIAVQNFNTTLNRQV